MLTPQGLNAVCKAFYERLFLEHLIKAFWWLEFADPAKLISLKPGEYMAEFRRWEKMALATTPLIPGVTPTPADTAVNTITVIPKQYGNWLPFSDQISMTSIDPVVTQLTDLNKVNAAETLNVVSRDVLATTGTNVQYANGKLGRSSLTAADKLTALELDKAVRTLTVSGVPKIMDEFGGSYIGWVHPFVQFDLQHDEDFRKVDEYAGGIKTYPGEMGRWRGIRLVPNESAKVFEGAGSGGVDVYATLVFGQHWYGAIRWADATGGVKTEVDGGQAVEVFVKPLGSGDDPLNQRGSVGWKCSHELMILNQTCGLRIETGASS